MYSPTSSSPRKGPFGSAKGSPRKTLLSPSDVTPFSFNGPDGLNIFGSELLSQTNGIIPMSSTPMDHRRGGGMSLSRTSSMNLNQSSSMRPRTQSLIPLGKSHSVGSGGMQRIRPTGSAGGANDILLMEGSFGGKSVKEYDNTLRDLQRDNFNLKLRIYFLEERMGQGSNFFSEKNKDESVIDLKMNIERLKYDNNEKTELLQEARFAIEDLENQLNAISHKREKENRALEDKVKSLEMELNESSRRAIPLQKSSLESPPCTSLFNSPAHKRVMSSGGEELGDSDDSLLREVEIEMRRKVNFETTSGPPILSVVHEHKEREEVVGRQQELEDRLDKLNAVIKETEKTLKNAQNDLSTRVTEIQSLKSQLKDKDNQIEDLEAKMEKLTKIDIAKETEIQDLRCKRDETLELLDKAKIDLESEIIKYDKGLRRKERIIKESDNNEPNDFGLATTVVTPNSTSVIAGNKWGLDVVTQSLHIPPSSKNRIPTWEVKKLREDIRILRDYLKIRVQEKKNLLQQIANLNKRMVSSRSRSMSHWSTSPPPLHEVVSVSCQTEDILLDRNSLRGRLLGLAESLSYGNCSSMDLDKIVSDLKVLASALFSRERRESGCSSSEWNGGLPDPSLLLPDLDLDEGRCSQRLYSFCNNNGLGDNFSIYSMLEQFQPTDAESLNNMNEEDNLVVAAAAFHSEDSWSQPDVSEARNRMGIPPLTLKLNGSSTEDNSHQANVLDNEDKESDFNNMSQRTSDRKSFYALEYTTQNLSHSDKEESTNYLDYSDETSRNFKESGLDEPSLATEDCIMGNCLRDGLLRVKSLMESLSFEIDSCHGIDSELSDDNDESFAPRRRGEEASQSLQVCYACSKRLSRDLQNHLISTNTLIQCSISALKRLKRIIQSHEIHSEKSRQELNYTMNSLSELESSLLESQSKSEEMEAQLLAQLDARSKELECKSKENQNLKTKLNENYNLVAQLSSENLSLSKEKTKLEEALSSSVKNMNNTTSSASPELSNRQYPLDKMNSSYRPLTNDCNGSWSIPLKDNRHSSNLRSSPETSSSFDFLPDNSCRSTNGFSGRSSSSNNINNNNLTIPLTPPPARLHRFGSRSSLRKKYRNSTVISEIEESSSSALGSKNVSKDGANKHFRSIGNLSGASDVSSPDLGVDMSSSDPFSSLERRCLSNSDAMNSVMHENYQLRRENKLLIEKLNWPKSSFKDTMD